MTECKNEHLDVYSEWVINHFLQQLIFGLASISNFSAFSRYFREVQSSILKLMKSHQLSFKRSWLKHDSQDQNYLVQPWPTPRLSKLSNAVLLHFLKYRCFGGKSTESFEKNPHFGPQHDDFPKIWPSSPFGLAMVKNYKSWILFHIRGLSINDVIVLRGDVGLKFVAHFEVKWNHDK